MNTFIATIEALEPHRVGHPLAAAHAYWDRRDDRGLRLLAERGITCEICPWSNHLTGILPIERSGELLRLLDQFHIKYESCPSCFGAFFDAGEFRDLKEHTVIERFSQMLRTLRTNL